MNHVLGFIMLNFLLEHVAFLVKYIFFASIKNNKASNEVEQMWIPALQPFSLLGQAPRPRAATGDRQ